MTRTTWTTAVILVGSLTIPPAVFATDGKPSLIRGGAAAERGARALQGPKLISRTSSPDAGREEAMFVVPGSSQLLVTSACVQHTAMRIAIGDVGDDENRLTFGSRGCTTYEPGFVVEGGQTIYCDNGSGVERACALVGLLEVLPRAEGQRAKFHELRR